MKSWEGISDFPFKNAKQAEEAVLRIFEGSRVLSRSGGSPGDNEDLYTCYDSELEWQSEGDGKKGGASLQEDKKKWLVRAMGCFCKTSWCPKCWPVYGKPALMGRWKMLDWRRVRFVMLSVDRTKFEGAQDCDEKLGDERAISNLIKNLKRTWGVEILDYVWIKEWHRDGFPHFNVLIEVKEEGVAGQIGEAVLKELWKYGLYVHETYIRDFEHWKRLIGYFDKHGYFEKGGFQGRLPEWALKREPYKKIRRWGAMRLEDKRREGQNGESQAGSNSDDKIEDGGFEDRDRWLRDIMDRMNKGFKVSREESRMVRNYQKECLREISWVENDSEDKGKKERVGSLVPHLTYEGILRDCGKRVVLVFGEFSAWDELEMGGNKGRGQLRGGRDKGFDDRYRAGLLFGDLRWGVDEFKKFDVSWGRLKSQFGERWRNIKGKGLVMPLDETEALNFLRVLRSLVDEFGQRKLGEARQEARAGGPDPLFKSETHLARGTDSQTDGCP